MKRIIGIFVFSLLLIAEAQSSSPAVTKPKLASDQARKVIESQAKLVVEALGKKDWKAIAREIDPQLGLCVSPYPEECREKLSPSAWTKITSKNQTRVWGEADGSGEPIKLSFKDYYAKFLYDRDYARAPEVHFNEFIHRGGNLFNPLEARPGAILVEYHFPGDGPGNWASLRLVFEQKSGRWYLTWLQHDAWTI